MGAKGLECNPIKVVHLAETSEKASSLLRSANIHTPQSISLTPLPWYMKKKKETYT